ncbi:Nn.00g088090.m01.CDS01 [Neocucurbitaria sp. VM-36]
MQSAASKRLLSTLTSKIHPQLPLSPRESQQLLTLLTTSFRAHLDREHPLSLPESSQPRPLQKPAGNNGQRSHSPARAASSYASATRHIDSILTNPLFAVKPHQTGSGPAAVDVLRDPMTWFLHEIATGAADLPKAAMCLEVLANTPTEPPPRLRDGRTPGSILAEWLQTSGLDSSKQFLEFCVAKSGKSSWFLHRLINLLLAEGKIEVPWRWFIRSNEQRANETGVDAWKVINFKRQLLAKMVSLEATINLDKGLATFLQAFRIAEVNGHASTYSILKPAGAQLVNHIIRNPDQPHDPKLYQSFLQTCQTWLGPWSSAVESMLWLHHPSQPSALPGLRFIQAPTGAITFVQATKQSRRRFLVQLCLGVARQLMEQEKYAEAQIAMEFTKEHFADIVLSKVPVVQQETIQRKAREERKNLELLDSLVPT